MSMSMSGKSSYQPVSLQETVTTANNMGDSLIQAPPQDAVPVASSRPVMQVVAPADLPEGYTFSVKTGDDNNNYHQVTVPVGGVEKGQTFVVELPERLQTSLTSGGINIPVGHWRDDLFDFFRYGICHAHCWTSWMCTFLAAAQIIRRLRLNWKGTPAANDQEKLQGFAIVFGMVVTYFVGHFGIFLILCITDPNFGHDSEDPDYVEIPMPTSFWITLFFYRFWSLSYLVLSTVILIRTRTTIRSQYGIPGTEVGDVCSSVFCHCCVAAQMLRHTANYDTYPAYLCTDTGLSQQAPEIV